MPDGFDPRCAWANTLEDAVEESAAKSDEDGEDGAFGLQGDPDLDDGADPEPESAHPFAEL